MKRRLTHLSTAIVALCSAPAFADLTIIEAIPTGPGQLGHRDALTVIEKPPAANYSTSEYEQLQLENSILRNEITRLQQLQAARYHVEAAKPATRSQGNTLPARGSAVVISNARLNQLVRQAKNANSITINGFTDSTGSRATNQRIAKLRAESLKAKLVRKGIPASKIHTQGVLGGYVATNNTAAGRAKNRRVVITFH
ncbi:outer membrane protein OmpA-like peptidoglycan-associated protein [Neisseria sp. HSC-16F19]|nr:OmpA family protein [Neisseria sp. HSC-16F19]MCP2041143.1 outer membrane protein OmpA-like peptidoglycan-associated protein [Neisseria sp. HSC-16F19]